MDCVHITSELLILIFFSFLCRMFKTDLHLKETCQKLMREEGWAFMGRYISFLFFTLRSLTHLFSFFF
jgi:hypothetical protein